MVLEIKCVPDFLLHVTDWFLGAAGSKPFGGRGFLGSDILIRMSADFMSCVAAVTELLFF